MIEKWSIVLYKRYFIKEEKYYNFSFVFLILTRNMIL